MCNYNETSRAAVQSLPGPIAQVHRYLGRPAYNKLTQVVASGRARPGHDLYDGKPLPNGSLFSLGYYMSRQNFERELAGMAADPGRCRWCHAPLPASLVRQHQQPHNHREAIEHHFHPACWKARLLAVAAIFGHVDLRHLLSHRAGRGPRQITMRQTLILSVKRVLTLKPRGQHKHYSGWHR